MALPPDLRVSHYFEWEQWITGGQAQSVNNQRTILDNHEIAYTTAPRLDVDLIHLNNMGPRSVLLALRARRRGIPVVVHTHQTAADMRESFAFSNWLARPLKPYLAKAYSLADHLICPSEHTAEVIGEYCDVPRTVVSNGYDPEKLAGYASLRERYLERYELDPPVVFTVGHVIERKGLSAFIETAEQLPNLDFAWFGYLNPTGGRLDRILRSRRTSRLVDSAPPNCTFTGYIEDIRGAYAAGDIFLFPTKNENEGMALLEAMATGHPPVVRDIPTFDWLEDGTTCLKGANEFAPPVQRLAADPDLRADIGEAAAEAVDSYTLDAVAEELIAVYQTVLED
ncbi:MAG: glycosyltransferase family 4 protein [Salinirussus sp.]